MITPELRKKELVKEIKEITEEKGVVVAFSGGMDSTLVLYLAKEALGREKVEAATIDWGMYAYTKARENVKKLVEVLGVKHTFIHGEKEIESLHARGPACNRCVKKIKIPLLKRYSQKRMILGGANQSDSWGKQHIKVLDNIYSPLIELDKKEIRNMLEWFRIPVLRVGENSIREGCILKHLWKPLASPYYHGRAVVSANEYLIEYLSSIDFRPNIANVKIIGPLGRNVALINVYPLPSDKIRKHIEKDIRSIKEIDKVYFVDKSITLVIRANSGQLGNKESIYWIEKGRISVDFGFPVKFEWLPSKNRKLNSFHVVDYREE